MKLESMIKSQLELQIESDRDKATLKKAIVNYLRYCATLGVDYDEVLLWKLFKSELSQYLTLEDMINLCSVLRVLQV